MLWHARFLFVTYEDKIILTSLLYFSMYVHGIFFLPPHLLVVAGVIWVCGLIRPMERKGEAESSFLSQSSVCFTDFHGEIFYYPTSIFWPAPPLSVALKLSVFSPNGCLWRSVSSVSFRIGEREREKRKWGHGEGGRRELHMSSIAQSSLSLPDRHSEVWKDMKDNSGVLRTWLLPKCPPAQTSLNPTAYSHTP